MRIVLTGLAVLALAACGGGDDPEPAASDGTQPTDAPETAAGTAAETAADPADTLTIAEEEPIAAPVEAEPEIDPFYLAIEIERWGVLIDYGLEALDVTPIAPEGWTEDNQERAYMSLRSAWRNLSYLKTVMCSEGAAPEDACEAYAAPDWLETDEPLPSLEELQARSDVLGEAQGAFVGPACDIAREKTGDEFACAVE